MHSSDSSSLRNVVFKMFGFKLQEALSVTKQHVLHPSIIKLGKTVSHCKQADLKTLPEPGKRAFVTSWLQIYMSIQYCLNFTLKHV